MDEPALYVIPGIRKLPNKENYLKSFIIILYMEIPYKKYTTIIIYIGIEYMLHMYALQIGVVYLYLVKIFFENILS